MSPAKKGGKGKVYALPTALKKKDGGVPKLTALRDKRAQAAPYSKGKVSCSVLARLLTLSPLL